MLARLAIGFTTVAIGLLFSPHADAQTASSGFQLDRYVMPMQANDLFWTERAVTTPHLRVGMIGAVGYQHSPLAIRSMQTGIVDRPVEFDVRGQLALGIGLFDRVQLSLGLPVVLYLHGDATDANAPRQSAIGDLRGDVRVRLFGENAGAGARFAVAGAVIVPLGDPAAFASDGFLSGTVRALFEYEFASGLRLAVNAGMLFRPTLLYGGWYVVDDEAFGRAGISYPLTYSRNVLAMIELAGATALAYGPGVFNRNYSQLELLLGAKYITESGTYIGLAGGVGLTSAIGTPDVRALVVIGRGYLDRPQPVRPGDLDHDGIENAADYCPYTPAGRFPDADRRGCPSHDNDRDGYVNSLDNCPLVSAGAHPDFARAGCPLDAARPAEHP